MVTRKTLIFKHSPKSLHWNQNSLIDWVNRGDQYNLDGTFKRTSVYLAYPFDTAIVSPCGKYSVIYQKLGTKGVLFKEDKLLREINRSYYQATVYEYPITFAKLPNGTLILIHCPNEYNLIEVEIAETGEKLTELATKRESKDYFYSRFRVNPSSTFLLSAGWVWHPYDMMEYVEIEKGLTNNEVFDKWSTTFSFDAEICSAEFLTNDLIIAGTSDEEPMEEENDDCLNSSQIGLYSISKKQFIKKINVNFKLGTIIPVNMNVVWNLYQYPQLVDLNTGKILQKFEDIESGLQTSSIIHHIKPIPPIAYDSTHQRLAIANENQINILTYS